MKYSFPINKKAINNYPNLKKIFSKDLENDISSKQIFRLLDNLHYDSTKNLVEFIEKFLSKDEFVEFTIQKIKTKDQTQFSINLKEIMLLDFLLKNGFKVSTFDNNKNNKPVPEYYIRNLTTDMLIEFYSPIELYGFDILRIELITSIKYFPNDIGFNCNLEVKFDNFEEEWIKRQTLPFELNEKFSNDKLRHKVINDIVNDLLQNSGDTLQQKRFYITNDIYISTSIIFGGKSINRQITFSTPSYDSVREYLTLQKKSKGFYRKLLHKINSKQLISTEYPSAQKVLFVDFSNSMGSEVLVEGMGKDFLSKTFYDNLFQRLIEDVSAKNVDLIFPIICGSDNNFKIGNCLFNPRNINIQNIFNAN